MNLRALAACGVLLAAIGAGSGVSAQDDPLGARWEIKEFNGQWSGVWIRRGSANVFDGTWTGPTNWHGGRFSAGLTINLNGNAVAVQRYNSTDGNDCTYKGTRNGNTVEGTYSCYKVTGTFTWSAVIHQGMATPRTLSDADRAKCAATDEVEDEVRALAMASQVALDLLRRYRASLDDRYEAERRAGYGGGVVDVASLAAGWPLGKMAESALREKVEAELTDKLLKAGFKSIDKRLMKDTAEGKSKLLEHLRKSPTELEGASFDLLKAAFKEVLGAAGDPLIGAFDMVFFAAKRMKDVEKLEALRRLIRETNARIGAQEGRHAQQAAMYNMAKTAQANCLQRVQNGQAPDASDSALLEVRRFLGH